MPQTSLATISSTAPPGAARGAGTRRSSSGARGAVIRTQRISSATGLHAILANRNGRRGPDPHGAEGYTARSHGSEQEERMPRPKDDLTRRSFLRKAPGTLAAAQALGALAAKAGAQQVPEPPGKKLGWAIVGLGSLAINQILPAFAKSEKSQRGRLRERAPRQGAQARAALRRRGEEHLRLPGLRRDQEQPRDRRRLRRAAEQHARRVHDPRAQGGQARAVREADGQHPGRVPGDDRRREAGRAQADGGLPLPLRALQPGDDPHGARAGARAGEGDRGRPRLQHRRSRRSGGSRRTWPAAAR